MHKFHKRENQTIQHKSIDQGRIGVLQERWSRDTANTFS